MTNILPPVGKKVVLREYWMRMVTAWMVWWSLCLVVGCVALLPTYVLLTGSNTAYGDALATVSERVSQSEELEEQLTATTVQARQLRTLNQAVALSEIMADVRNAARDGMVNIDRISIERTETSIAPVVVSGVASDRQALSEFQDALLQLAYVQNVSLPIGNLAQKLDVAFSLQIDLEKI